MIIAENTDEYTLAQAMKPAANDYFLKGFLTRLVPAVDRELQEAEDRRVEEPGSHRGDRDGDEADDDAMTQFDEVLDESHATLVRGSGRQRFGTHAAAVRRPDRPASARVP